MLFTACQACQIPFKTMWQINISDYWLRFYNHKVGNVFLENESHCCYEESEALTETVNELRMDGWMNEWMNERMSEWMNEEFNRLCKMCLDI
jgi:hypothetical protein